MLVTEWENNENKICIISMKSEQVNKKSKKRSWKFI